MATKLHKDDKKVQKPVSVLSRCIAIVLKPRNQRSENEGSETDRPPSTILDHGNVDFTKTGKEMFQEFRTANKNCYWNSQLDECTYNVKYVGYIEPYTLLVGGKDTHLDTLRSTWAKRILKAPKGYIIQKLGEITGLEMTPVQQTQYIPLPDALCLIVTALNDAHILATLEVIRERLQRAYKGINSPSEQVVYDTLSTLISEKKLYHNGKGYYIVTPETYNISLQFKGHPYVFNAPQAPPPPPPPPPAPPKPVYIPVPTNNTAEMCSISCQTNFDAAAAAAKAAIKENINPKANFERSASVRVPKNAKKEEKALIPRSKSMRFSEEKSKQVVRDINLKTSNVHQEKDKAEKKSILSKLFGRNKGSKKKPVEQEGEVHVKPPIQEVEYATFSAQFPPPDMQISQLNDSKETGTPFIPPANGFTPEATHAHILRYLKETAPYVQNGIPPELANSVYGGTHSGSGCPVHDTQTKNRPNIEGRPSTDKQEQPQINFMHGDEVLHENHCPYKDLMDDKSTELESEGIPKVRKFRKKRQRDKLRERNQFESVSEEVENNNIINQEHPINGHEESAIHEMPTHAHMQKHIGLFFQSQMMRQQQKQQPNVQPGFNATPSGFHGNDISVQYHGKMPKKNSMKTKSCDSGVNAIGLNLSHEERRAERAARRKRELREDSRIQREDPQSQYPDEDLHQQAPNMISHKQLAYQQLAAMKQSSPIEPNIIINHSQNSSMFQQHSFGDSQIRDTSLDSHIKHSTPIEHSQRSSSEPRQHSNDNSMNMINVPTNSPETHISTIDDTHKLNSKPVYPLKKDVTRSRGRRGKNEIPDSGLGSTHTTDQSDYNKYSSISTCEGMEFEHNPARKYIDRVRQGRNVLPDISDKERSRETLQAHSQENIPSHIKGSHLQQENTPNFKVPRVPHPHLQSSMPESAHSMTQSQSENSMQGGKNQLRQTRNKNSKSHEYKRHSYNGSLNGLDTAIHKDPHINGNSVETTMYNDSYNHRIKGISNGMDLPMYKETDLDANSDKMARSKKNGREYGPL
ncbi:unnamed protein product [Owenia fusiformis]|uniref:Uncharacterized protein n=1 Tax=Owenia fusiformis TaxID=6347 RepID=A0A8J1UKW1_OWEFU|nr:unnamed protein product [Owenia fusiformis]